MVKAQSEANSASLAKASSELLHLLKTGVRQLTEEVNTVDNDRIFFGSKQRAASGTSSEGKGQL
jgi:hypothetical protein